MLLALSILPLLWGPGPAHPSRVCTRLPIRPSTRIPGLLGCPPHLSQSLGQGEEPEGAWPHAWRGSKETGGTVPSPAPSPQPHAAIPRVLPSGSPPPLGSPPRFLPPLNLPNCLLPEKT